MSDSDSTPDPGAGSPPPPPPSPPPPPTPPTPPTPPGGPDPSAGAPGEPEPLPPIVEATPTGPSPTVPDPESTTVMPALPPTEAGPALPPAGPMGADPYAAQDPYADPYRDPYDDPYSEEPAPWYKQPGVLVLILLVVAALAALLAWLILGGRDDDDDAGSIRLVIELGDGSGQPVDRQMSATVQGPAGAENAYDWLRPADAIAGEPATDVTGTDGRIDFEWIPDPEVVTDPATWTSTIVVLDGVPAGWTVPGPVVECVLERPGADESAVALNVQGGGDDATVDRFVTYTFPSHQFVVGDTVTCALTSTPPPTDTTTVDTTTVDTTVPDSASSTSSTSTTTTEPPPPSTITVPPQPAATLWDVIVANPDLSGIRAWIEAAGLQDQFDDPNATLTLLAPSNQAITEAPSFSPGVDFGNSANLLLIVNTHLVETGQLRAADIAALTEIDVVEPGPHPVDTSTNPPKVGGATMLVVDVQAANGILHVIDRVLLPVAPLS